MGYSVLLRERGRDYSVRDQRYRGRGYSVELREKGMGYSWI